jgi:hypothetical protein
LVTVAVQSPVSVFWAPAFVPAIQASSTKLVINAIAMKKRFQIVFGITDLRGIREFQLSE